MLSYPPPSTLFVILFVYSACLWVKQKLSFSCSNTLFRITLQVFLDRFVEREIQSLLVHCIHQEEGCDWKDELRKREVTTKLLYDVQISNDVYPLPALLTRAVPVGLICSRETLKSGHSSGKNILKHFHRTPCHLVMKVPRSL